MSEEQLVSDGATNDPWHERCLKGPGKVQKEKSGQMVCNNCGYRFSAGARIYVPIPNISKASELEKNR